MSNDNDTTWVSLVALVLVVAVASGLVFIDGPLESRRPAMSAAPPQAVPGEETVPVRMWQDPLHAIQSHWHALVQYVEEHERIPFSHELPDTITEVRRRKAASRFLAIVPGTHYVEDRENRRRQRRAVVAALAVRGFVSEDPEHIGYFVMPRLATGSDGGDRSCDAGYMSNRCVALVGFENYRHSSGQDTRLVQVLWLNADDFASLDHIAWLLAALGHEEHRPAVVFGPYTSGALREMVLSASSNISSSWKEFPSDAATILCGNASAGVCKGRRDRGAIMTGAETVSQSMMARQRRNLRVLSSWATAPLNLLLGHKDYRIDGKEQAVAVERRLAERMKVRSFRSVVARDDLVMLEVLRELKARGACSRQSPRIAIVSEEDTAYGQTFSGIVKNLVARFKDDLCDFQVERYGYLRGLDGELPPENPFGREERTGADTATIGNATRGDLLVRGRSSEEPAGRARLDYVRRLANVIGQRERVERGFGDRFFDLVLGRPQPVAIGVLGSDVYDKLVILEALRDRIPAAVFFTTDLDARLTDSTNYPVARNLLVGSTYGFAIRNDAAGGWTVFRSAYEAGMYRSVALVLEWERLGESDDLYEGMVWTPCPRVFEIGRTGPIDITRIAENCRNDTKRVDGEVEFGRSGGVVRRVLETLFLLAPVFGLIGVAIHMESVLPDNPRRVAYRRVRRLGATSVIVLFLIAYGGTWVEPAAFFEGISAVPTFVLQITTVVFAICFRWITAGRIAQGHDEISRLLGRPPEQGVGTWRWRQVLRCGCWIRVWRRRLMKAERKRVRLIWREYLVLSQEKPRILRIGLRVVCVVGTVLALLMFERLGPYLIRDLRLVVQLGAGVVTIGVAMTALGCIDRLNMASAFIRMLVEKERGLDRYAWGQRGWKEEKEDIDGFVYTRRRKMSIIAEYTDALGPVMVFPFLLLLLPIATANTISEGWVWSWRHVALYAALTLWVLTYALRFQFEAVRSKERILSELEAHRQEVVDYPTKRGRLELAIEEIQKIEKGAFVPWTRHPVMQSVGASGIAILTCVSALL